MVKYCGANNDILGKLAQNSGAIYGFKKKHLKHI